MVFLSHRNILWATRAKDNSLKCYLPTRSAEAPASVSAIFLGFTKRHSLIYDSPTAAQPPPNRVHLICFHSFVLRQNIYKISKQRLILCERINNLRGIKQIKLYIYDKRVLDKYNFCIHISELATITKRFKNLFVE